MRFIIPELFGKLRSSRCPLRARAGKPDTPEIAESGRDLAYGPWVDAEEPERVLSDCQDPRELAEEAYEEAQAEEGLPAQ